MKKQIIIISLFLLSALTLQNCSNDKTPSESEARQALGDVIFEKSEGRLRLTEFNKTNGLTYNIFGREIYTLEYSATVELLESGYNSRVFNSESRVINRDNDFSTFKGYYTYGVYLEAGIQAFITGKICFEKTENGWRKTSCP